jgi:hypothetical protein
MANEPLQNFRAVEPANYGFGASATIASQPFVLNHLIAATITSTGPAGVNVAAVFPGGAHTADRFLPWISKDYDTPTSTGSYYPVKVPNAYDRIYIFTMYQLSTTDTQINANSTTFGVPSTYAGPWVVPMGLQPQTRGFSTSNKLNPKISYLPDDLISKVYPTHTKNVGYDLRTHGSWTPLPAYSSNFSTSNGIWNIGAGNNPSSYGRATIGTGTAYSLPDDLSVSKAAALALAEGNAQFDTGSPVLIGMGHEFQTMGSEEIVCCIGSIPSGVTITHPASNGKDYLAHWFTMGMFLG